MQRWLVTALAAVLLVACGDPGEVQRQAASRDDGLQATGRLGGSNVAISSGDPEVLFGDCDPADGADRDLCIIVRTIDGLQLNLVLENPSALVVGEAVTVARDACAAAACDDLRTHLVVDLRRDGDQVRATGGQVTARGIGDRIAADFRLHLPDGDELTGSFDVLVTAPAPGPTGAPPAPSPT